jgi:hypothetical protein
MQHMCRVDIPGGERGSGRCEALILADRLQLPYGRAPAGADTKIRASGRKGEGSGHFARREGGLTRCWAG